VLPGLATPRTTVYVHVPFCTHRCDYCAFTTFTDRHHLIDDYVDACVTDVRRQVASGELVAADTVYVGGGTPSLVPAPLLVRILDALPRASGAEVTVEVNPDSVDVTALHTYARAGVTRISVGVQSTQPAVLAALGRTHDRSNVARTVAAIGEAGIGSFNLDLIAGAAGESAADFARTLDDVLALEPPHVSVYGLMVEPGTPLARRIGAGEAPVPDPDGQAERYLEAEVRLSGAGLDWYEVSNWARPGHECRHNLGYWAGADCRAIGAAAHGHAAGTRWWNVPTPEAYIARVAEGRSPVAGSETPDAATLAAERLGLALRTRAGVEIPPDTDPARLADLVDAGLVEMVGGRVVCTPTGRLLVSEVTLALWPDG
jgi:oxygen-independent coproporphyrinogen-3 oxidase